MGRTIRAWLYREIRAAARHRLRPRVFALGDTLTLLGARHPALGVRLIGGSLGDLLHGRVPRRSLSVAYAADVVGYLDDRLARAAVLALFRCVAPGGRLLLASFAWDVGDAAYELSCRHGWVVARDVRHMRHLIERVPPEEIAHVEQFPDSTGMLCFTRVTRD